MAGEKMDVFGQEELLVLTNEERRYLALEPLRAELEPVVISSSSPRPCSSPSAFC